MSEDILLVLRAVLFVVLIGGVVLLYQDRAVDAQLLEDVLEDVVTSTNK